MAKKTQSRAQAKAASKSRPQATSQPGSSTPAIPPKTAFSPRSNHLAILSNTLDRQRLSVYETSPSSSASRLLVHYVIPNAANAPCSAIAWTSLPPADARSTPQSKKHKKSRKSTDATDAEASSSSSLPFRPIIALGFQSGQIRLFDVAQAKVIRVLADSVSGATSAVGNAITSLSWPNTSTTLYAIATDGILRQWDLAAISASPSADVDAPVAPAKRVAPSSSSSSTANTLVSISPSSSNTLVAHHSISQLSSGDDGKATATYSSHATPLTHLHWLNDSHFVSAASEDPVLYVWKVGTKAALATIELEQGQDVLRLASSTSAEDNVTALAVVASQGFVGLYDVTKILSSSAAGSSKAPSSTQLLQPAASTTASYSVDCCFSSDRLQLARLIKGLKLEVPSLSIRDVATNALVKSLAPLSSKAGGASGNVLASGHDEEALAQGNAGLQRYANPTTAKGKQSGATTAAGGFVGEDGKVVDASADGPVGDEGALDQEAGGLEDEQTLEDRLRGMRMMKKGGRSAAKLNGTAGDDDAEASSSDSEDDDDEDSPRNGAGSAPTTSLSLSTSLSQALHSSDSALISSLLRSANPQLIKSTVIRLSGPNAVKLLEACVERLHSRGGAHGSSAASRGTVGSNRARGLVEWVKWTLRLHAGYLMSLPGLTSRLAALHGSLTHRLASHQRLVALQGRLELVLAQVEMRGQYDAQGRGLQGVSTKKDKAATAPKGKAGGTVWKEDDDEDEDEEDGMSVDEDEDEDDDESDSDDDDDDDDDEDDEVAAADEEGDIDEIGLDSHINGAGAGAEDDDDDSEEEVIRPAARRRAAKAAASKADTSALSGAATSDESGEEDEEMDDDDDEEDDEEDEDEEDESELEDDDEEEDEEDDDDDEEGGGGLIDDMAEESDGEEESDEESD
ncbi:NUC189-domain-containing protein [Jaminaea rosea]|uniref:NUC189-domain-containing protein n=1 Tax=Jaminaea rosea TaxID=1569628 RepID=A0A316V0T7_9BASI|nr:NUC189-domain-containing protein [Jaminaea rosea]PWN29783.1 NUC189-domain-containing protein [Jaminaea rosea]